MPFFADRVKVVTATTGAGTVTLGAAVARFRTFAAAAIPNSSLVRYLIEDGAAWEIGIGTYNSAAGTLTRSITAPGSGSSSGALLALSGAATVAVTFASNDIRNGCQVGLVAGLNINTSATIGWDVEDYDDGGWHDNVTNNSRLTVPAGVDRVQLGVALAFNNVLDNAVPFFNIGKNGNFTVARRLSAAGSKLLESTQQPRLNACSGMIIVVPGDYFEVQVNCAPADTSYDLLTDRTFFWIIAM